jgi:uncharacterized membrane protein (UPF0182 family)
MTPHSANEPAAFCPHIPSPAALWGPVRLWTWLICAALILAAIPHVIVQYWFNSSLGFRGMFFTNVTMQALLFFGFGTAVFLAVHVPMRLHAASTGLRRASIHVGLWLAIFAGWRAGRHYLTLLLAIHGVPFGRTDPVFGHDIGFYVYWLPVLQLLLEGAAWAIGLSIVATLVARFDALHRHGTFASADVPIATKVGFFLPRYMRVLLDAEGLVVAGYLFLTRYGLLFGDNEASGVRRGAEYVDVTGVFSTLHYIHVSIVVELALCVTLGRWMKHTWDRHAATIGAVSGGDEVPARTQRRGMRLVPTVAVLLAVDLAFFGGVVLRDHVFVRPNEPWIQIPYIQRHIDATLAGYRLERVKSVPWTPGERALTPGELLASKTVEQAPILPSWVASLEAPPDVQHLQRLNLSNSLTVYGPMLDIFNQQQALRPYYQFTGVDGVRYTVNGEKRMFVSGVRELPSLAFLGPKEWLRYWGSAALMLTHGYGLVMSPADQVDEVGNPRYVSADVPPQVTDPGFEHEPRIYFGEGAKDDYVLTNVRGLKELDHATAQSRQESAMPEDLRAGVRVDSLWKRIVFAAYTRDLTAFLFSNYIDRDRTRVHIFRTPFLRAQTLAPFLFLDSNTYAFIADRKVLWMINALSTSDRYPYAFPEVLGDKAEERAVHPFPERTVNYAEDSVKITMDAYSGEIAFYQMTDDPIISSWARVYPSLFRRGAEMPAGARAQMTYPLQWFHVQFDDIYKRYHQTDPIQFYNVEDLWDDADEVLGSLGRGLKGFGSTDQSTFSFEGHPMLIDPADLPPGVNMGAPGALEYCLVFPFTPEGQRNLRSLIVAFQDPDHYGELVSLQIPQGQFVPGPEQIESYIDNDRPVHQQVTMWMRHASEVIRGHMVVLPVKGDLMYAETIWVNSTQNDLPQLKLVAVRYRGRIASGPTLAEAIRALAIDAREGGAGAGRAPRAALRSSGNPPTATGVALEGAPRVARR